ncbi:retrovirus-related pol polyprotein from transposon TNT 1-94 [Tanacetum coccineum]
MLVQEEPQVPENEEISINYIMSRKVWNRNEIDVDDIFAYNVALEVMENDEDQEPKSMQECRYRNDWPKWKDAIEAELKSLEKRKVFGPIVQTPKGVKPVGYKWVFVRKRNEKNEITRYKARLVAQGFSQRPGIDYEETYSPVVDATTLRYLISLVIQEGIDMRLMDVVTAYLYGSLDTEIYMKLPEGFKLPETCKISSREKYAIKLNKSLYGLKQSGRMWYNRLSEYLLKEGYKNDSVCPCIFIKRSGSEYVIIAVYVDDLNIIGTPGELPKAIECLKGEFEMKDLGKTKFCKDDPFRPRDVDEEILGPEVPYLSAIGALMFLAGHTRPDIAFSLNLLARFSSCPTRRHWNGVKQIFRYLQGTKDMGLYFTNPSNTSLVGFADAGYMSDHHNGRSQLEILAIHEASRECVWLRNVTQHIRRSCGISSETETPTVLYEDNAACIAQLKEVRSSDNLADLFTKALPTSTFRKLSHNIGMRRLKDLK